MNERRKPIRRLLRPAAAPVLDRVLRWRDRVALAAGLAYGLGYASRALHAWDFNFGALPGARFDYVIAGLLLLLPSAGLVALLWLLHAGALRLQAWSRAHASLSRRVQNKGLSPFMMVCLAAYLLCEFAFAGAPLAVGVKRAVAAALFHRLRARSGARSAVTGAGQRAQRRELVVHAAPRGFRNVECGCPRLLRLAVAADILPCGFRWRLLAALRATGVRRRQAKMRRPRPGAGAAFARAGQPADRASGTARRCGGRGPSMSTRPAGPGWCVFRRPRPVVCRTPCACPSRWCIRSNGWQRPAPRLARRAVAPEPLDRASARHAPSRGVDRAGRPRHHAAMESPKPPRQSPDDKDFDAKTQAWLELKREMEQLHASVEYLRLILKMGVKLP